MDNKFQMTQCGYFPASQITSVSTRGGYIVIAGNIRHYEDMDAKVEARVYRPLQKEFGGGARDAYFEIFKMGE